MTLSSCEIHFRITDRLFVWKDISVSWFGTVTAMQPSGVFRSMPNHPSDQTMNYPLKLDAWQRTSRRFNAYGFYF